MFWTLLFLLLEGFPCTLSIVLDGLLMGRIVHLFPSCVLMGGLFSCSLVVFWWVGLCSLSLVVSPSESPSESRNRLLFASLTWRFVVLPRQMMCHVWREIEGLLVLWLGSVLVTHFCRVVGICPSKYLPLIFLSICGRVCFCFMGIVYFWPCVLLPLSHKSSFDLLVWLGGVLLNAYILMHTFDNSNKPLFGNDSTICSPSEVIEWSFCWPWDLRTTWLWA